MGWETAWFSEIDPYASAVLAKHWPGVPNLGDITKIEWQGITQVDLLCGGFPCQDISNAGKRAGITGERSGLWGEFARAIRELRPRYVVVENVAALLTRGMDTVLGDLAEMGYDAEWQVLLASEVGAPHLRARVWIVADTAGACKRGLFAGWGEQLTEGGEGTGNVAYTDSTPGRIQQECVSGGRETPAIGPSSEDVADAPRIHAQGFDGGPRQEQPGRSGWWLTEPNVGRVAHGIPSRVDRLRGLGNSLVPECAYQIFQEVEKRENEMRGAA